MSPQEALVTALAATGVPLRSSGRLDYGEMATAILAAIDRAGVSVIPTAELHQLRAELRLHNRTPGGTTMRCMPSCPPCACLALVAVMP